MSDNKVSQGRLVYIEPNEFASYKVKTSDSSVQKDNLYWDYEDLHYTVDLQVIKNDRSDCGQKQINDNIPTTIENGNNWVSFMQGQQYDENGNNILTTAYTDISYQEYTSTGKSQKEALGITSINVNFDSHFFPLVTINFTDVRGAALFSPSEYNYMIDEINRNKKGDEKNKLKNLSSSFFKALFHFPYPRFLLSIKGYYGDRVTFQLAVSDFKTSFNPQSGNFDVTVSFIGYMYGLYTDIPMSLIFCAPYYNSEYWDKKKKDGTFEYVDGGKILTFLEFLKKYYEMTSNLDDESDAEPLKNLRFENNKKNLLNKILIRYRVFEDQFRFQGDNKLINDETSDNNSDHKIYTFFVEENEKTITKDKYSSLKDYIEEYNNNKEYSDDKIENKLTNYAELDKITLLNISETSDESIKNRTKDNSSIKKYYYFTDSGLVKSITEKMSRCQENINSYQKRADEAMAKIMKNKLGFTLNVENTYRMIFAHIDTFIASFNDLLANIKDPDKQSKRTMDYLGLNSENSDMPIKSDSNTFVPAFPLYKLTDTGDVIFPGSPDSDNAEMKQIDEVEYVNNIIESIKTYQDTLENVLEDIKKLEESKKEKEEENATDESNFTTEFKPSMVSDIFYHGKNPYLFLKKKLEKENITNNKAKYIAYFMYSRLCALCVNDINANGIMENFINNEIENFKSANIEISNEDKKKLHNYDNIKELLKSCMNEKKYIYSYKPDDSFEIESFEFAKDPFNKDVKDNMIVSDFNYLILNTVVDNFKRFDNRENLGKISKDSFDDFVEKMDSSIYLNTKYHSKYDNKYLYKKTDSGYSHSVVMKLTDNQAEDMYNKVWEPQKDVSDDIYGIATMNKNNTSDYFAGTLQFNDNEDGAMDNPYISRYNGGYNDSIANMQSEEHKEFRAVLLLASLYTYFNNKERLSHAISMPYIYNASTAYAYDSTLSMRNINSTLIELPKVLVLYLGACQYFKKNYKNFKYKNDSKRDKYIKKYIDEIEKNNNNLILSGLVNKNNVVFGNTEAEYIIGASDEGFLSKEGIEYFYEYFIRWCNSEEFKTIDAALQSNSNKDIFKKQCKFKSGDNDWMYSWKKNSKQDNLIKQLLVKKVMLFKEISCREKTYDSKKRFKYEGYVMNDTTLKSFFDKIGNKIDSDKEIKTTEEKQEEKNRKENDDNTEKYEQKRALYYTLKTLYDKWLCSYTKDEFKLKTPSEDKKVRKERYELGEYKESSTEFNNFVYIDSFYNDISSKYLMNPTIIRQMIESFTNEDVMNSNTSVFEFMAEMAEKNNLLFISIPVYNNFYNIKSIENIFTPNFQYKYSNDSNGLSSKKNGNTYMLIYTGEASSKLETDETDGYQGDGVIYDVMGMGEDHSPVPLPEVFNVNKDDDGDNYTLPAFGVTYGKQNQMYFKNISVNMDNPKVTDYSIANMLQIANGGAHGTNETYDVGVGQNIYSIYSNRSYTCTVEMLGCMNIMPMMYFQLNNIPMFRGFYIIISVSHSIIPGNVITKFTGVRISKNHIKLSKCVFDYQSLLDNITSKKGSGSGSVNLGDYKDYDYSNVGKYAIPEGPKRNNSKKIAKMLQNNGYNNYAIAALLGVIGCESAFGTELINKGEKNGTYKSSGACYGLGTNNNTGDKAYNNAYSYGAGLIHWSYFTRKLNLLKYVKGDKALEYLKNVTVGDDKPGTNGGIESCTMEEQTKMLINELKKSYKNVSKLLSEVNSVHDATKVVYNYYVAHSNTSATTVPSDNDVTETSLEYVGVNVKSGFEGAYMKRLRYANWAYENINDLLA